MFLVTLIFVLKVKISSIVGNTISGDSFYPHQRDWVLHQSVAQCICKQTPFQVTVACNNLGIPNQSQLFPGFRSSSSSAKGGTNPLATML